MGLLNKIFPGQDEYYVPPLTVSTVVFPSEERARQSATMRAQVESLKRKAEEIKKTAQKTTESMTKFAEVFGASCGREFRKGNTHAFCEIPKNHAGPHLYRKSIKDQKGNITDETYWFKE